MSCVGPIWFSRGFCLNENENIPSNQSDRSPSNTSDSALEPSVVLQKTADRPHRITICLGLLSPILALVSFGVSFYVFKDSQQSMRVAERAYLGFHFVSGDVEPKEDGGQPFHVAASVIVKDVGKTPAYIDTVKKELYTIDGDNVSNHIGGESEESPNFDPIGPDEPLVIEYTANFSQQNFTGDRSVVYRIEIHWHDAFNETQTPAIYCGILRDVTLPIEGKRELSAEPCMKGMTFSIAHN